MDDWNTHAAGRGYATYSSEEIANGDLRDTDRTELSEATGRAFLDTEPYVSALFEE